MATPKKPLMDLPPVPTMAPEPKAPTFEKPTVGLMEDETVEGRMAGLMSKRSPLMDLAASRGIQSASRRGVQHSSLAAGESMKEMIKAAYPIARDDAAALAGQRLSLLEGNIRGGLSREQIESTEGMQAREIEAATATAAQRQRDQKELLSLEAQLGEARAAGDHARAKELETMMGTTKERIAIAGNVSRETIAAGNIEGMLALQNDSQEFDTWSQEQQQEYGKWLQTNAQDFEKWKQNDQQLFLDAAREDVQNWDSWEADKQRAYGLALQDDAQAWETWSQDDKQIFMDAAREDVQNHENWKAERLHTYGKIMQDDMINFNKWEINDQQAFMKVMDAEAFNHEKWTIQQKGAFDVWLQTDSQNFQVEAQKRAIKGKMDLQDAAISGDEARLATQIKTNKEQWQKDWDAKLELARLEIDQDDKNAMSNSTTALSDTYMREVNNIQRDPNILAENKAAAIQSASNVYYAQLATIGSIFGTEIEIDFGEEGAASEEGETPYVAPEDTRSPEQRLLDDASGVDPFSLL